MFASVIALVVCTALAAGCGGGATSTATSAADTSGGGAGWRTFTDPAEAPGATGPDIRTVSVSHDTTSVRFRVRFASAPPLAVDAAAGWADVLLVGIDVPPIGPAPRPNEWRGVNYVMGMHGGQSEMRFRTMGGAGPQLTRLPVQVTGPVIAFSVKRAMLGNPDRFVFNVATGREGRSGADTGGGDLVPGAGTHAYVLSGSGG